MVAEKNRIILLFVISLIITVFRSNALANSEDIKTLKQQCLTDLDFIQNQLEENSASYANKDDKDFHYWYNKGYEDALELIESIGDKDDCYYIMKYYVNGFGQSHVSIRGYYPLPAEMYPGFIVTRKVDGHFRVVYKNPSLTYLKGISIGDKVTHIDNLTIEEYYEDYVKPFYANDESELTTISASVFAFIIDGNRFKPIPRKVTVIHDGNKVLLDLKYTELKGQALDAVKKLRQPDVNKSFSVEMLSNGVWIKIPTFFPSKKEVVYYTGMLSTLKNGLAKEDFIIFDMRGNRGGASKWAIPLIRNLWGDLYLKSLKSAHDYNRDWIKKIRISKKNLVEFRQQYDASSVKSYITSMKKGESYYTKKWSIYDDTENLYTNTDNKPFRAKIYVLTDNFCRSTCWNFVKELKQIPGVTHLGQQTAVQSIYSHAYKDLSPSKYFDLFYPTQMRVQPDYKLEESLIPDHIFGGDPRNEVEIIDWVLSIVEQETS